MIRAAELLPHTWAVVLAGGAGTRLRSLTTDARGVSIPKQFWSLRGDRSLLGDALARAARITTQERVIVVVAREHEPWWKVELADHPRDNVLVQPRARGTAPGILLPLRAILERDREARVAVLPSDHFVRREPTFERSLRQALRASESDAERVTLLGIAPDAPEHDYGWIVPAADGAHASFADVVERVVRFVEKPPRDDVDVLRRSGALWNSFVFTARAAALERLFERRLPELCAAFAGRLVEGMTQGELDAIYAALPETDFSRAVLQGAEGSLGVLRVPECGWTDLGTPERVSECLAACAAARVRKKRASSRTSAGCELDLSRAVRALDLPQRH